MGGRKHRNHILNLYRETQYGEETRWRLIDENEKNKTIELINTEKETHTQMVN